MKRRDWLTCVAAHAFAGPRTASAQAVAPSGFDLGQLPTDESAPRIGRALRSISNEAGRSEEASDALVATLARLADIARHVE